MTPHQAKAEHHTQGWVAVCSTCDWMGSDHRNPQGAAEEARQHRHGKRQPWSLDPVEPRQRLWGPL